MATAISEMARVTRPGGHVIFDIVNALHPTQSLMFTYANGASLLRKASAIMRGKRAPMEIVNYTVRTPWGVSRIVKKQVWIQVTRVSWCFCPWLFPVSGSDSIWRDELV